MSLEKDDHVMRVHSHLNTLNIKDKSQGLIPETKLRAFASNEIKARFERRLLDDDGNWSESLQNLWRRLLETLRTRLLPRKHLIAASNAVCVFLENASSAGLLEEKGPWKFWETWENVFDIYLDAFENGREKPMKQVLETLIKLLRRGQDSAQLTNHVVVKLLSVIFTAEPRSHLKASLVTLEAFLRRDVIDYDDLRRLINTILNINPDYSSMSKDEQEVVSHDDTVISAFSMALIRDTLHAEAATGASRLFRCFSKLCIDNVTQNSFFAMSSVEAHQTEHWTVVLRKLLVDADLITLNALSVHIFPVLFEVDPEGFLLFITENPSETSADLLLRLAALQTGKALGLVVEKSVEAQQVSQQLRRRVDLDPETIGKLVAHSNPAVRLRALTLLVSTPGTTQPFSSIALHCLTQNLRYVHGDNDAQIRNEVFTILRQMIGRIRGGSARLLRVRASHHSNDQSSMSYMPGLNEQKEVLEWYISFLQSELNPAASYQRRIFALQVFKFLIQSGLDDCVSASHFSKFGEDEIVWPFNISLYQRGRLEAYLTLLLDPYDDVRATSHTLLKLYDGDLPVKAEQVEDIAKQSRRGDHADGLGRLYDTLLSRQHSGVAETRPACADNWLEDHLSMLELATKQMLEAATDASVPPHGLLLGFKYMLNSLSQSSTTKGSEQQILGWVSRTRRLLDICRLVWKQVQSSLCQDSPEGQYDEDDVAGGSKDILAFSWRALRDSSLVLQSMLSSPFYAKQASASSAYVEDFRAIGSLCFDQLSMLRHRGAFSTVSQTFALCCRQCGMSSIEAIHDLPRLWLTQALEVIQEQASKLTRRSAGLPSLVTGILSCGDDLLFEEVMTKLSAIAATPVKSSSSGADLPQVHALNCLKDIFTNKIFASATEPWILDTLRLASKCLSSPVWAIHNCGLMLFRALTLRMCRVRAEDNEQLVSDRLQEDRIIPADRYQDVFELISDLLNDSRGTGRGPGDSDALRPKPIAPERISAALDLTIRMNESIKYREKLQHLTRNLLGVSSWILRDNAARTFASLVAQGSALTTFETLGLTVLSSQNAEQGRLLCMRYVFQKALSSGSSISLKPYLVIGFTQLNKEPLRKQSPTVMSAVIELINDVYAASFRLGRIITFDEFPETNPNFNFGDTLVQLLNDQQSEHTLSAEQTTFQAPLREALATAMLMKSVLVDRTPDLCLSDVMSFLLTVDANAGCSALKKIEFAINDKSAAMLLDMYLDLLSAELPEEAIAITMRNLATISQTDAGRKALEAKVLGKFFDFRINLAAASRELFHSWLRLEGGLLGLYLSNRASRGLAASIPRRVSHWALAVRECLEDVDPSSRLNAAQSLAAFQPALAEAAKGPATLASMHPLPVYAVLYDTLNDDDEEVRDMGAGIVSSVAAVCQDDSSCSLCPLAAAGWLVDYLVVHFKHDTALVDLGLERLLTQSPAQVTFTPFKAQLGSVLAYKDDRIFAEEEQNLYIDYVREIGVWGDVLKRTSPAAHERFLQPLRKRALDALRHLGDYKDRLEGTFGLASKPEVLALVNRARVTADVVLSWAQERGLSDTELDEMRVALNVGH